MRELWSKDLKRNFSVKGFCRSLGLEGPLKRIETSICKLKEFGPLSGFKINKQVKDANKNHKNRSSNRIDE